MQEFIASHIISHMPDAGMTVPLRSLDDAAVVDGIVFTTDGHTVKPLFFPGGDIGSLSVAGTVNDIAVIGGDPLALSCALIIEEGLDLNMVDRAMASLGRTAKEAGVPIATGDTKVMEAGAIDQMIVVTSAVGKRSPHMDQNLEVASKYRTVNNTWLTDDSTRDGDVIILSGNVGEHGIALLSFREGYGFESEVRSDIAPLNGLITEALKIGGVVAMKDPTRGGLANTLNEWSQKSGVGIEVEESSLPLTDPVRNAADLLGIDPLSIGNEGKVVVSCVAEMAEDVLKAMRGHQYGKNATIIGRATSKYRQVVLHTEIGGKRILEAPMGDPVPRIC